MNDEAGRRQQRLARRAARGLGAIPDRCVAGHDMSVHARLESDGTAYCQECKRLDKRAQRDPSTPRPHRPRPASVDEVFRAHTVPVAGGHLRWAGKTSKGTPIVRFGASAYSAYRVAFRIEHGREPEGHVSPGCGMPLCVAGTHVEDRPMRKRTNSLYDAIFGAAQ